MSENNKSNNNNAQKSSNHKSGQHKVRNRRSRVYKTKKDLFRKLEDLRESRNNNKRM